MELLQEWVVEILAQEEEAKEKIAQIQVECVELISEEIAVQIVDTLKEKTVQAQTQAKKLKEKFQAITKEREEVLVSSFDHVFAYIIFQRPPFLYLVPPLLALF
jgi:hypothetical protein